jgi:hypothetical protein
MLRERAPSFLYAALLLGLLPLVIASPHGGDDSQMVDIEGMKMDGMGAETSKVYKSPMEQGPLSYFRLEEHSSWIYGHIFVMTICWAGILPISKTFYLCRGGSSETNNSRHHVQRS